MSNAVPRPRVAAIGLDDPQIASIEYLCGTLRLASSLEEYLQGYSWTETDVVVSKDMHDRTSDIEANILAIGTSDFKWGAPNEGGYISTYRNTERELSISPSCPDIYKPPATELSSQLSRAVEPPVVAMTFLKYKTALIETTSGRAVAMRLVLPTEPMGTDDAPLGYIALLLPEGSNLSAWFRAFLWDLHTCDPAQVPQAPPRLNQPSDWYTPQERILSDRISQIQSEMERLSDEVNAFEMQLASAGEKADKGIRQALWGDGDGLIAAVREMLTHLGFTVRNMDAEVPKGELRREDMRLTLAGLTSWQGLVEVKGYTNGIRTNDNRQIREYRDRYIQEQGRPPDLTVWLSNPFRTMDPSFRPAPDQNVKDAAEAIGAVHVLASDLYRQWTLVASGSLEAETIVESLRNADPGLWSPPVL